MRVQVVCDREGRIVSVSQPGDLGERASGIAAAGIVPESGQQVHEVEVPEDLRQVPLVDLHARVRLETGGGAPRLVSATAPGRG